MTATKMHSGNLKVLSHHGSRGKTVKQKKIMDAWENHSISWI